MLQVISQPHRRTASRAPLSLFGALVFRVIHTSPFHIWIPAFPTDQVRGLKAHRTARRGFN